MSNALINKTFLDTISSDDRTWVLANIASHYGCTRDEALAELLDEDAEHLLEYVCGPDRWRVACQMSDLNLLQPNQ